MNSRTKEIYIQAHELEKEGREAFLVEACGEDTELRREVQDLLDRANRVEAVLIATRR